MVTLVCKPHPLKNEKIVGEIKGNQTILAALGDMPANVFVQVSGQKVSRKEWNETVLEDGDHVLLYANPEDDVARSVALIAVAVAAPWAIGAIGLTGLAATAATAGLTFAGSLAINALIPPKQPSQTGQVSTPNVRQAITGTSNQADLYGQVTKIYGNPKFFPKLAAKPITEIAGNDQYLRMMLLIGYGPLEIAGHRVGVGYQALTQATNVGDAIKLEETNIGDYEDVEWQIGTTDAISLDYPDINEEQVGVALNKTGDEAEDVWKLDGNSAIRTTAVDTKEVSLDLVAPQGIFSINGNGSDSLTKVEFKVEYKKVQNSTWIMHDSSIMLEGPEKDTLRKNIRFKVSKGQYDVRVTRNRTYTGGIEATYTDVTWSVLRSIQSGPAYTGDHVVMALRIRANDQLNGTIDRLSVKAQAVLRVYNGTSFSLQATNNPAWAYLDCLTGPQLGNPVPDNLIDIESIREWALFCDAQGLSYSFVHDANETVLERAMAIASAGLASYALQDGKFGVIFDDPNTPVVQAITPRNAFGFSSERVFKDLPHALRVKYIDPNTWTDAERIVYREGYDSTNASRYEDFQTQGVASADEAYIHGMYHIRQAVMRPETFQVTMDWENLAIMRGNRVRLAYDVIKVGLGYARVESVSGSLVTLDNPVPYETSKVYGIRVRGSDKTSTVTSNTIGDTYELELMDSATGIQVGDLIIYGESGRESLDCKVTNIDHDGDFQATVTLVPAAMDILDFSSAPAYDPGITNPIPIDQIKPPVPEITNVRGDQSSNFQNPDGSLQTLLRVAYAFRQAVSFPTLEVEARYKKGSGPWNRIGPFSATGNLTIDNVQDGATYHLQLRAKNGTKYSEWSAQVTTVVNGSSAVMPDSVIIDNGTFSLVLKPQNAYKNLSYEFFRSDVLLVEGDIVENAKRLGIGNTWTDTDLQPDTTYYYYVRGWSASYTTAFYFTQATTDNSPTAIMGVISGEIKQGDLWPLLSDKIDDAAAAGASITDLRNDVDGIWGFRIDNDGLISGMVQGNDGTQADTIFRTDTFSIAPPGLPGSEVIPFIVSGNQTFIKEALIGSLTFDKLRDAQNNFVVQNGRIKAEYLQVNQMESQNFNWSNKTGFQFNADGTFKLGGPGEIADSVTFTVPDWTNDPENLIRFGDFKNWPTGWMIGTHLGNIFPNTSVGAKVYPYVLVAEETSDVISYQSDLVSCEPGEVFEVESLMGTYSNSIIASVQIIFYDANMMGVSWQRPNETLFGDNEKWVISGRGTAPADAAYVGFGARKKQGNGRYMVAYVKARRVTPQEQLADKWVKPGTTTIAGNQITSGDVYVDTINIKGQAVTFPISSYSSATQILTTRDSWQTIRSMVTNPSGGSIIINFGSRIYADSNGPPYSTAFRLLVNGSEKFSGIISGKLVAYKKPDGTNGSAIVGNDAYFSSAVDFGPTSSNVTIQLQAVRYGDTGSASNAYISCMVGKR